MRSNLDRYLRELGVDPDVLDMALVLPPMKSPWQVPVLPSFPHRRSWQGHCTRPPSSLGRVRSSVHATMKLSQQGSSCAPGTDRFASL